MFKVIQNPRRSNILSVAEYVKAAQRPIGTGDLSMMARAPLATKATSVSQGHQKTEE